MKVEYSVTVHVRVEEQQVCCDLQLCGLSSIGMMLVPGSNIVFDDLAVELQHMRIAPPTFTVTKVSIVDRVSQETPKSTSAAVVELEKLFMSLMNADAFDDVCRHIQFESVNWWIESISSSAVAVSKLPFITEWRKLADDNIVTVVSSLNDIEAHAETLKFSKPAPKKKRPPSGGQKD